MATNIFVGFISGGIRWVKAISSSAGAADANKIVATNSTGRLDSTLMPTGIAADTVTAVVATGETLSAGDWVNEFDNSGTPTVRQADASNARKATGFVLAGFSAGQTATIYPPGSTNNQVSVTPGVQYFLSNTSAGSESTSAPDPSNTANDGHVIQPLGIGRADGSITMANPTGAISISNPA